MRKRLWLCGVVAAVGVGGGGAAAAPPESAVDAAVREAVAGSGGMISVESIGESTAGRPIHLMRVSKAHSKAPPDRKPALLIVSGLDPRDGLGPRLAVEAARRLAVDQGALLDHAEVYVVPALNPDGLAEFESAAAREDSPRNRGSDDADRDGRVDEDGPVDLNGDGVITQIRVSDAAALLRWRLETTHIAEPDDARLLRPADRSKGERPVYAVLTEGRDQDGDGRIAEDGLLGLDVDAAFPYHWPEYRDGAGSAPLSAHESRALAAWLIEHPEVVAVVCYAPSDNLVNTPGGSKMDPTGQIPITNTVLDEDRWAFEGLGKEFKEITKQTGAPSRSNDGTLQGWAYAHLGLVAVSTPGWVRADQIKKEEEGKKKEEGKKAGEKGSESKREGDAAPPASDADVKAKPEAVPAAEPPPAPPPGAESPPPAAAKPERKNVDSEDGKWLACSDSLVDAGKPGGFVEWKEFDHPQLGKVEIGGFVPGFRTMPHEAVIELEGLAEVQSKFLAKLVERLPRVSVMEPSVEALGGGVYRIAVRAVNEGPWPTRTAMGLRTRRLPQSRFVIELDRARIVAGDRLQGANAIAGSGGSLTAEWTITGSAGEVVVVRLASPECGSREVRVTLP